ncbi:hypothetical protein QE368_000874 [Asaia bogorensis NBRC 16594]|nr:hypothetical protein [Asaia bogorensis NBRC 16594]
MFRWIHRKRFEQYERYERAIERLETAVAAGKRSVIDSDKRSAEKAINKALQDIKIRAIMGPPGFFL